MATDLETTGIRFKAKSGAWLVHPDLRAMMIADARGKSTNLSDLAVQILCARFNVSYTPNARRSSPSEDADQFNLRIPPELERVISATYPKHRLDAIRRILCAHYGLAVPPKVKTTRRRRGTPVPRTQAA